jgi:hypothetical protein
MPKCIFCDKDVPHAISKARPEKSLCLDCLIEMKRFEAQNMNEIMRKLYPDRVVDAIKRLKTIDASRAMTQEQQAQMLQDVYTAQEVLRL